MTPFSNPIETSILLPALKRAAKRTFRTRPLTKEEIERLKGQGCRSASWERIRVAHPFRPDRVFDVEFRGEVVLGQLFGSNAIQEGVEEPAGLARVTLENCWIEDGVAIRDTHLISNMHIGSRATIVGCGLLIHSPGSNFGVGRQIALVETGGRVTRSFPEMTIQDAAHSARTRNLSGLAGYLRRIEAYAARAQSPFGVVESGAVLLDTPRLSNVFIGQDTHVLGAQRVSDTVILSDSDHPVRIEDGAIVTFSVVQPGCEVSQQALVQDSVLCEYSRVERHGKVMQSIIGPNSAIAEGEVTSSLVGPFVGFHHQALLIGVVWPEGKGNIAYGCNCGSNHTGKAPDQEFWPGEGLFLGLGVNVKFPGSFVEAPYTMVATGVDLLPQKVEFPFSLIFDPPERPPGVPAGFNELIPGWALSHNLFAVKRNEWKFRDRDRSVRSKLDHRVFRREIVEGMLRSRERLLSVEPRDFYTERHIQGLGKNFMRESVRQQAVDVYGFHALVYALEGVYHRVLKKKKISPTLLTRKSADPEWEYRRNLIRRLSDVRTPDQALWRYLEMLRQIAVEMEKSKARDDARGGSIIPDYQDHHLLAHENPFIQRYRDWIEEVEDRVWDLLENR